MRRVALFVGVVGVLTVVTGCSFDEQGLEEGPPGALPNQAMDPPDEAPGDEPAAPDAGAAPAPLPAVDEPNAPAAPRGNGVACASASECGSGFCVDGVCCTGACGGACLECNHPDAPGICRAVSPGLPDPRGLCVAAASATCGQTGLCDGGGSCARYSAGTVCKPAFCAGGMERAASICDGQGSCKAGEKRRCKDKRCGEDTRCAETCTDDDRACGGDTQEGEDGDED